MLRHFINLLVRSWFAMVAATGTNTLGFVIWTLGIAAIAWGASVAANWWELRGKRSPEPLRAAVSASKLNGIFSIIGIFGLALVVFCGFVVSTIYKDHQSLTARIRELQRNKLQALAGSLTLAVPGAFPKDISRRSLAIIYGLSFANGGEGTVILNSLALKIKGKDGTRLYTPIVEIDYERFIRGTHVLNQDSVRGPFEPFTIKAGETSRHWIMLSQDENDKAYPFKTWIPGKYDFELWVDSPTEKIRNPLNVQQWEITQTMIENYFKGMGSVIMPSSPFATAVQ